MTPLADCSSDTKDEQAMLAECGISFYKKKLSGADCSMTEQ